MGSDLNVMIGGEAGQGVQSLGFILAKSLARGGYHVFADQDYESRIRGGHNFFRVRVSDRQIAALTEEVDILIAMNKESLDLHLGKLMEDGVAIFDEEATKDYGPARGLFGLPLERLARERAGDRLMSNSVALGAALGLVRYGLEILDKVLAEHFKGEVAQANILAARAGYDYIREKFKGNFNKQFRSLGQAKRMLLNGNEALALGAVAAGCKFVAAYPMTPATTILEYLAGKAEETGMVVVQPEDEIAAINMIIGAAFAGARAMTCTSGGGFCLMVEGLGLAGITETPVVIVNSQRSGPGIGLPTRTEQGDLEFVLHAAHGEFPRAVLAPATVEDVFYLTAKAFNLAEKYQTPVIILTDQYIGSSYATVERFDLSKITIERGQLLSEDEAARLGQYKRYQFTESGVSPRALPLYKNTLVVADSDEHNEEGHPIEDAETRTKMMLKRLRKLEGIRREIGQPRFYGSPQAELTLVGWGSTYGALKEAVDMLQAQQIGANLLHLNELWPFPAEAVSSVLGKSRQSLAVENNATGQLARLIRRETGLKVSGTILKFDGRPFSPAGIVREAKKEVVHGKAG